MKSGRLTADNDDDQSSSYSPVALTDGLLSVQAYVLVWDRLAGLDGVRAVHGVLDPDGDAVRYGHHEARQAARVRARWFRLS